MPTGMRGVSARLMDSSTRVSLPSVTPTTNTRLVLPAVMNIRAAGDASFLSSFLSSASGDSVFSVFGPVGSETRKRNDIYEITRGLNAARVAALPYFYLDCGNEDFLVDMNQKFATLLREKKIPHEYRELPGNHNWEYWDQQVREVLKVAAQKMRLQQSSQRKQKRSP